MRLIEARWLREFFQTQPTDAISPILEVGASSALYRTVHKPYIEQLVHAPLRDRGARIVTADLRGELGVEIVGDVFDPAVYEQMVNVHARTLMCCNVLEHLTEPVRFAAMCTKLVVPGGRIIVTVPHDYPYHLDPIDTMFRPDIETIHALFPRSVLEVGEILVDSGYWSDLRASHGRLGSIVHILKEVARSLMLVGGRERARSRLSKLRYLFRNYKIAVAVLTLPETVA